jgi:tetratricopeptide (TPR) repeat protein
MKGMRSVWCQAALIAVFGVMLAACAPRKTVTPPGEAAPQAPGRPPQVVRPLTGEAEVVDLKLVEKEIRKREAAVASARSKREELSPTRRAVLDAWVTALEDQVGRMKEIMRETRSLGSVPDPQERARRSQRLTALLLECLSLSPLEPPFAAAGPRVQEETRISWEPLRSAYQRGDCSWFLQEHEALSRTHSDMSTPLDVQMMRGVCLGRSGKRQEALKILEPLSAQGLLLDAQQVRYLTANWLFEEGHLEKAAERYKALLETGQERERWAELARLRLEQIKLRKGEPVAQAEVQRPPEQQALPTQAAQEPPAPSLSFPPREPIAPPSAQAPPVRERPPEEQTPALQPPPSQPPAQPTGGGQEVQLARLQEAQRLMDAEQYEEAIQTFQQVQAPAHEEQVRKGIQEAQDRYAEKRRKEAADLVLRAREEGGSKRKANLLKALEILEETNRRYPNNRYAAKIQQNIQDLMAQIRAIDPGFRN